MKKIAMLLAVAAPLLFSACGDDDPKTLKLDNQSLVLTYQGASYKLTASEKNVAWESSDAFIAEVKSDGTVEPKHVGTCTITATKDGATAKCAVTVDPLYNTYVMPITAWGKSVDAVKSAFTGYQLDASASSDNTLFYIEQGSASDLPAYLYRFNAPTYSGLFQSAILENPTESEDEVQPLDTWLAQYYAEEYETEDYDQVWKNSKGEEVISGYVIDDETYLPTAYAAYWTAPNFTKTRGAEATIKEAKAFTLKLLKK